MASAGISSSGGVMVEEQEVIMCAACNEPMMDSDGVTPRSLRGIGHRCDYATCKLPMHAPMVCNHVWFPVVSSNGREFCSKTHLVAYNADEDDRVASPVPVRRRQDQPDEISASGGAQSNSHPNNLQKDGVNDSKPAHEAAAVKNLKETAVNDKSGAAGGTGIGKPDGYSAGATGLEGGNGATHNEGGDEANENDSGGQQHKEPIDNPLQNNPPKPPNDDKSVPASVPADSTETDVVNLGQQFPLGARIKMNFKPQGSSWYGGIVGHTTLSTAHIGFDDGELRLMDLEEVAGLSEFALLLPLEAGFNGGLIDDNVVTDRAEAITIHKEGRMSQGKAVGVLVGTHMYGVAGLNVHKAHHVDTHVLLAEEAAVRGQSRTRQRGRNADARSSHSRKGYHTFCCGNVVQCTHTDAIGHEAVVFGVVVATVGSQQRRLLVLYERGGGTDAASRFFVAPWSMWRRVPPAAVPESADFEVDDDEQVQNITNAQIDEMIQEWNTANPMARHKTAYAVVNNALKHGLPPSLTSRKPVPPAAKPAPTERGNRGGRGASGGRCRRGRAGGGQGPVADPTPKPLTPKLSTPKPLPFPADPASAPATPSGGAGETGAAATQRKRLADLKAAQRRTDAEELALKNSMHDIEEQHINLPTEASGYNDAALLAEIQAEEAWAAAQQQRIAQLQQQLQTKKQQAAAGRMQQPAFSSTPDVVPQPPAFNLFPPSCYPARTPDAVPFSRNAHAGGPTAFTPASMSDHAHGFMCHGGSSGPSAPVYGLSQQGSQQQPSTSSHQQQGEHVPHHILPPQHYQQHYQQLQTPESERTLKRHIRILRAQQIEDGVQGLGGKLAGLEYELESKRKDRKRSM